MKGQHNKEQADNIFVPKEGQPDLLCCSKKSAGCPSLSFEYVEGNEDKVNKAFDILLREALPELYE